MIKIYLKAVQTYDKSRHFFHPISLQPVADDPISLLEFEIFPYSIILYFIKRDFTWYQAGETGDRETVDIDFRVTISEMVNYFPAYFVI